jgi:trans-aconitate 2-methyltransferase
VSTKWDPQQYLRFADERARPFNDLMSRVPHPEPRLVVDLGCGPGTLTARLSERWPAARVVGVDSSAEMIEAATPLARPGRLEFHTGDLRDWVPDHDQQVDVLVSNATLHWVADHCALFPRLLGYLAPGGFLAFQVPGNFEQPSHVLLKELATSHQWADLLGPAVAELPESRPPAEYLRALLAAGAEPEAADVWETTYLHLLAGPDAVLQWVKGTGMRPVLRALESSSRAEDVDDFLASYGAALRAAYPRDAEGRSVFPFRRIFAVAQVA